MENYTFNFESDILIKRLTIEAQNRLDNYIDMLYVKSYSYLKDSDTDKTIEEEELEKYLFKRGYVLNYVRGERILTKGFVCVKINDTYIETWHDKANNDKSVFVKESVLTGLPITLNYMESL